MQTEVIVTRSTMRQQLADIVDYINLSYIAEDYFGKSPAWFYKKLKGQGFNAGTSGVFSEQEVEQLRSVLLDLSSRIEKAALEIK